MGGMSQTPSSAPAEPFLLRRIALSAYGPTVLASLGHGAVLPVLALSARALGASVGVAALTVALLGIGQLAASLPSGALAARVGERRALMVAGVIDAVAMTGALLAHEVWLLAVAVFVMGIAGALFNLARQAYLTDLVPVPMRARALSTLGGVHRIGLFAGPFVGAAVLAEWDIRAAYAVAVATSIGAFLLVALLPDLTAGHERATAAATRRSVGSVLLEHRRTLLTLGTGVLAIAAARGARTSLLPLWAEHIGLDATDTALVFGIAGALDMLLFYPAGAVMDRFGRAWVAVPTVVVLGIGMAALPLTTTMPALTVVALLMALGNGLGSGIVMTLGADAAPADARPQFLGGWRLFVDSGVSGGPLLVSAITVVAPLAAACVVLGGISFVGGAWLARWVPRYDPTRQPRSQQV
ncbi:putative MFS family arabinose efflux permease [Phycicoccus sp. SLBN-51]|nr:putative MFS family arabinose efflux permease [Phycicoccus sp. SLBN-51]